MRKLLVIAVCLFSVQSWADADFLLDRTVPVAGANAEQKVNDVVADLRGVFENFVPAVDSSSRIVSPYRVSGRADSPEIQVSIQKCILLLCKTVDLDGEVSIRETQGSCPRTFLMTIDLTRSSQLIVDYYDRLEVGVCFTPNADGSGQIELAVNAHRGGGFQAGAFQGQILSMLKLQADPIVAALKSKL